MKQLLTISIGLIVILCLIPTMTMAQGAPPATPIDGGLTFLFVAGGAYGVKKVLEKRKQDRS